jgi:hypothetical protein
VAYKAPYLFGLVPYFTKVFWNKNKRQKMKYNRKQEKKIEKGKGPQHWA